MKELERLNLIKLTIAGSLAIGLTDEGTRVKNWESPQFS
jgi:hypothetical protein